MTKALRITMAAVTAGAAVLSAAAPAAARDHHRWHNHHNNDDGDVAAAAVVAGVLGLAIGAAIVASKRSEEARALQTSYYVPEPVEPQAYAPPVDESYAPPAPRACTTESWSWNSWAHRYVRVITSTPC